MTPVPILTVGRSKVVSLSVEKSLSPHIVFPAIISLENFSGHNIQILLETLNPTPAGVLVGGGVSNEIQDQVEQAVEAYNASTAPKLGFVRVPIGSREELGPEGQLVWLKETINKTFGTKID